MSMQTRQPSRSPAPDPRRARIVTEDEMEAMSQDQTDELMVQAATSWVFVLPRTGGQAFFVPDPALVREAAARLSARDALDQKDGPPSCELD